MVNAVIGRQRCSVLVNLLRSVRPKSSSCGLPSGNLKTGGARPCAHLFLLFSRERARINRLRGATSEEQKVTGGGTSSGQGASTCRVVSFQIAGGLSSDAGFMDSDPIRGGHRRRRCRVLVAGGCALAVLLAVVVVPAVVLSSRTDSFKAAFIQRCERMTPENTSTDCVKVWSAFEQAYIGRDPCEVPQEAYSNLLSVAPPQPACNRMLFWSGTKQVAQLVSEGCDQQTLEDTLLGSVLDGQTWCGKEGSSNTFTSGCPGWSDCENNPVRSFWERASAEFAAVACGDAAVLLNGSREAPFRPTSIFGSIEVKKFTSDRMKSLTAILATNDNVVANCTDESLKNLQKELKPGIKFICKEVTESELLTCKRTVTNPV